MTTLHEAMENLEDGIPEDLREDWVAFRSYTKEIETNYMILHQQMQVMRKAIKVIGDPIPAIEAVYASHKNKPEHLQPPGEPDLGERS